MFILTSKHKFELKDTVLSNKLDICGIDVYTATGNDINDVCEYLFFGKPDRAFLSIYDSTTLIVLDYDCGSVTLPVELSKEEIILCYKK